MHSKIFALFFKHVIHPNKGALLYLLILFVCIGVIITYLKIDYSRVVRRHEAESERILKNIIAGNYSELKDGPFSSNDSLETRFQNIVNELENKFSPFRSFKLAGIQKSDGPETLTYLIYSDSINYQCNLRFIRNSQEKWEIESISISGNMNGPDFYLNYKNGVVSLCTKNDCL